ncbi:hypothetical protein CA54_51640 [Symmachiella macrocystis]|uniref:Uncharacterized protein n=1 Tax=Symmachiella macrocystis TaxID=2527985 RepID=A0A5C6B365_9PLAN|nr:hypothetical protein [Symmachiella macrocystis]TWU06765.1 hypothetical protein CA54_51640 [Symmachiella macrocystis]
MAKQFAIRLSLIMFAVSVIESAVTGEAFHAGLITAGTKAVCFFVIGLLVGEIARRVVEENAVAEFAEIAAPSAVQES